MARSLSIIGFLALAMGLLWIGQGTGSIRWPQSSVMINQLQWAGYGAVLGLIATPILLVNAFSPTVFALIVEQVGWQNAFDALLVCAILSWLAIELMSRWYEGAQSQRRDRSPVQGRGPKE